MRPAHRPPSRHHLLIGIPQFVVAVQCPPDLLQGALFGLLDRGLANTKAASDLLMGKQGVLARLSRVASHNADCYNP